MLRYPMESICRPSLEMNCMLIQHLLQPQMHPKHLSIWKKCSLLSELLSRQIIPFVEYANLRNHRAAFEAIAWTLHAVAMFELVAGSKWSSADPENLVYNKKVSEMWATNRYCETRRSYSGLLINGFLKIENLKNHLTAFTNCETDWL